MAFEVFEVVDRYVAGRQLLRELHEWLVPRLGEYLADSSTTESQLAGVIELAYADVVNGEADENDAREMISDFLRENTIITFGSAAVPLNATSNEYVVVHPSLAPSAFQPLHAGI